MLKPLAGDPKSFGPMPPMSAPPRRAAELMRYVRTAALAPNSGRSSLPVSTEGVHNSDHSKNKTAVCICAVVGILAFIIFLVGFVVVLVDYRNWQASPSPPSSPPPAPPQWSSLKDVYIGDEQWLQYYVYLPNATLTYLNTSAFPYNGGYNYPIRYNERLTIDDGVDFYAYDDPMGAYSTHDLGNVPLLTLPPCNATYGEGQAAQLVINGSIPAGVLVTIFSDLSDVVYAHREFDPYDPTNASTYVNSDGSQGAHYFQLVSNNPATPTLPATPVVPFTFACLGQVGWRVWLRSGLSHTIGSG